MKNAAVRWWRIVLGLAVTVLFVALLLRQVEPDEIVAALGRLSLASLLLAGAFLTVDFALRILRWWWMLRALGASLSWRDCVRPYLASIAVNNVLPLRAGDALRVVGFRDQLGAPVMQLLGTVIIERLLDVIVLLAVFFLGSLPLTHDVRFAPLLSGAGYVAAALLALILAVVWFHPALERFVSWVARHPAVAARNWTEPLEHHGRHLLATTALLRRRRLLLPLMLFSAAIWACEGVVFVIVAQAVGAGGATAGPWFAMATGTLATTLPSSPGYVGTFHYFAMLGLAAHGADPAAAAGFAVAVHLLLWVPLTAAGLICLLGPGRFLRSRIAGSGEPGRGETP